MKCVLTGKETNMLTCNIPLSREGRSLANQLRQKYHNKILESTKEELRQQGYSDELLDPVAEKLSLKLSVRAILELAKNPTDLFNEVLSEIVGEEDVAEA